MTNWLFYLLIAVLAFGISSFLLKKAYQDRLFSKNALSLIFYALTTITLSSFFIFAKQDDAITPIHYYQFLIPLFLMGVLSFFSKRYISIIICAAISLLTPIEAVTNYFLQINAYTSTAIIFAFLVCFSYLFETQNKLEGLSFIQISTMGLTFFGLYHFAAAPYFYGLMGLYLAGAAFAFFHYTKLPIKMFLTTNDNRYFGVFVAWIIVLASKEYLLLPMIIVFSMFFANIFYNIFQKIFNLNLKESYDIYKQSIYQRLIEPSDLYSFILKTYFLTAIISMAPMSVEKKTPLITMSFVFAAWFLNKTYNLYQKKVGWKDIASDVKNIKEKIGQSINDKSN